MPRERPQRHATSRSRRAPQLTPPLVPCAQAKNVAVVVVTGDRGLCGGYNAQMIKKAEARIVELQSQVRTSLVWRGRGRGRVDCQGRAGAGTAARRVRGTGSCTSRGGARVRVSEARIDELQSQVRRPY